MIRTALAMSGLGGLVVAFFAVFGGMALVTGTGVIVESGLRSEVRSPRLSEADVVVSARQRIPRKEDLSVALPERATLPVSLVDRLAGLPGVESAVGDLSFPAAILPGAGDRTGRADPAGAGHGWGSLAFTGGRAVGGVPPRRDGEVAVAGARVGQEVRVVAGGRPGRYRVTAVIDAPGLYFADSTAARLAGRSGRVDLVALRAEPGVTAQAAADAAGRLLGDRYEISTGGARGDAERPGTAAARGLLIALPASIGGISLITVGFVIGGGLSLSINRQRRDLALLRAAGATPRQVRRLVAVQGGVAALAALAPGAALGYYLAARLGELLADTGMLPTDLPLTYGPLPAVAAAVLLLGVVRVAAWTASLRASRMPPVSAVAESKAEPREPSRARTGGGLLLMLGALVLSSAPLVVRTEMAAIGPATAALLAIIGLALAGPRLVQVVTGALARRLPQGLSAPLWLAITNSHGYALRTAGAVAALGMVVTLGLSVVLTQTTISRAKADEARAGLAGVASVSAPGLGGIPHGLLDDVRARPGVTAAATASTTTVLTRSLAIGDDPELHSRTAMVLGPDAHGVVDLGVVDGSLAELRGDTVALDARLGEVGERLDLLMGDGTPVRARVVATYSRALGFGQIVVSRDLAAGHTTTGLDSEILVRPATADLAALVEAWPGAEVSKRAATAVAGEASAQGLVNIAVLAVLIAYVLVSVANRLVATTTGRGEELLALRRLGATPEQVRRMLRWESLVIALLAAVSGLVLAGVPLALLSIGFLGRPWPAGPLWLVPASVLVVAMVVWPAVNLPVRRRHLAL
ncbi:FtsX-like permease family protein [Nonomuraea africana]|uniref:ABC transport system permease protein n=1 Tax=Nonomuraea africana TaxID=46171 RepID=A0ABR9KJQ0_9ACTN|nr:FtsX-like permease family protein [Nonomuraea africana]MBE1562253.1 putative ABC transport system permease protein [Nonomuraea africana]